jgi:hypothetical protein
MNIGQQSGLIITVQWFACYNLHHFTLALARPTSTHSRSCHWLEWCNCRRLVSRLNRQDGD